MSANLIVPNQGIHLDKKNRNIRIPCLSLDFNYVFPNIMQKINQIEINDKYFFISCKIQESGLIIQKNSIGVDLNVTGHCAVAGSPLNGKILKLGKDQNHIRQKYKNMRKELQKNKKYKALKKIKKREKRKIKNLNHKISKKIVSFAKENNCNINLENIKGIRKAKVNRPFRHSLNSWSFYQLKQLIEYKAKKSGVLVSFINPKNTSKICSRCGLIGQRNGKIFKCTCGHVDHADVNASFNIALNINDQSMQDRDCIEGSTDTPKEDIL